MKKTLVHFDSKGSITVVVQGDVPAGAGLALSPRPGHSIAELEDVENLKASEFRKFAQTHRVASPKVPPCKVEKIRK